MYTNMTTRAAIEIDVFEYVERGKVFFAAIALRHFGENPCLEAVHETHGHDTAHAARRNCIKWLDSHYTNKWMFWR